MTLVGFKGQNHPQQIDKRGALDRVDDRGTPPELFDPLNDRFGFTIDVAAAPHNAKCERYYTLEDDGLAQPWAGQRVWCNPPYSAKSLAAFTAKAWQAWQGEPCNCEDFFGCSKLVHRAELIVMLVPANRPEQAWWQDYVEPHRDRPDSPLRVEFLRDRRRFIRHDLGHTTVMPNERPPFGVCLLIWSDPSDTPVNPAPSGRAEP